MYKFEYKKEDFEKILNEYILNEREKKLFSLLVKGGKRTEVYEQMEGSQSTIDKEIRRIAEKLKNYENGNKETTKVYMFLFPNNKKYIGVCNNCKDRWNNGYGYSNNTEMTNDIKKYGWENIEKHIVFETNDSIIAYDLEKNLIKALDLTNKNKGYNKI